MSVKLDMTGEAKAEKVRANVLGMLHTELKRELSDLLDDLCGEDEIIRIDRLELNLGNIKLDELGGAISKELFKGIYNAIAKAKKVESGDVLKKYSNFPSGLEPKKGAAKRQIQSPFQDQKLNTLFYYLEFGVLPWWKCFSAQQEIKDFIALEIIAEKTEVLTKKKREIYNTELKQFLIEKKAARLRFISQFSESNWNALMEMWFPKEMKVFQNLNGSVKALFKLIRSPLNKVETIKLNVLFFEHLAKNEYFSEKLFIQELGGGVEKLSRKLHQKKLAVRLKEIQVTNARADTELVPLKYRKSVDIMIQQLLESKTLNVKEESVKDSPKAEKSEVVAKDSEAIRAFKKQEIVFGYAGVVIIWPMLTTLFKNRALIENGVFKNERAQLKGLQLLNYLVAGEQELDEFDMPLNKLLCGLAIDTVCLFDEPLSEEAKEEVTQLLEHVVENWAALKNTSPDGLRSAFIARQGELIFREGTWFLKVEQNGIDILLIKLPWGYHTIKLSWMSNLIQVEW